MGFVRIHSLLQASSCSGVQSSMFCAPPWTSTGWRGIGASPWSAPWSARESQLQHLVSLTYSHSSFLLRYNFFFFFLKYLIPETLPLSLIGLALASNGSVLEPIGIVSTGHRNSFWQLLTKSTSAAPLLLKPHQSNSIYNILLCHFFCYDVMAASHLLCHYQNRHFRMHYLVHNTFTITEHFTEFY